MILLIFYDGFGFDPKSVVILSKLLTMVGDGLEGNKAPAPTPLKVALDKSKYPSV